jgi:hypothetical protein
LADKEGSSAHPEVGPLKGNDDLGRVLALVVEDKTLIHPDAVLQDKALIQERRREEGLILVFGIRLLGVGDGDQVQNPTGRRCPLEGSEIAHRTVCSRLPHAFTTPDAPVCFSTVEN